MIGNRNGSMPFAMVAVTILLLAAVSGAVTAGYAMNGRVIDDAEDSVSRIDSSMEDAGSYINRELGIMILGISKDASIGSLNDRADAFEERGAAWVRSIFPMNSGGIRIELVDVDLQLTAEAMGIVQPGSPTGGFTPSYLRGTGTVVVTAASQFGSSTKDLPISTDGSYALPLAIERGSLFERMAGDGGITVAGIMEYELQSLAQFRVLNGFGSKYSHGPSGTSSIITAADVRKAYDDAIGLISTVCFRDNDDPTPAQDPAWSLAGEEVLLDASEFCGQVLMSAVDDIVLKWFDYFCLDYAVDMLDAGLSSISALYHGIIGFFTDTDPFDISGCLSEIMDDVALTPGSGTTEIVLEDLTLVIDNPTVNILEQDWVRSFKAHYIGNGNYLRDVMRESINGAADNIMRESVEDMMITADDSVFIQSVIRGFGSILESFKDDLWKELRFYSVDTMVSDPFLSAIADAVQSRSESFVLYEEFRMSAEESLSRFLTGSEMESDGIQDAIDRAVQSYRSKVYSDLEAYDRLRDARESDADPIVLLMTGSLISYLKKLDIDRILDERAAILLNEIAINMDVMPRSPLILSEEDCFSLVDEMDNITREFLDVSLNTDPVVELPRVVEGKCSHITGFMENVTAGYSTTFSVKVSDLIAYSIEGRNGVSSSLEHGATSSYRDQVPNSICIEVSVSSAWPLAGVSYSASNTVFGDAFDMVYPYLEPFLEPLFMVIETVKQTIEIINGYLTEIAGYISDIVARLYEALLGPLTELSDWINEHLESMFGGAVLDMYYRIDPSHQQIGFQYMGYDFNLRFDLASLNNSTKTLFVASLSGPVSDLTFEASITAKVKGEMNAKNVFITGKGAVMSEDWKVDISLDPLMKGSRHLLTISAKVGKTDISAAFPVLDDYNELGVTLSRVPGVGEMLDNIPLPFLGVNVGFDAGISVKYGAPVSTGLLINEMETNPPGKDAGNEWVELLNNSDRPIELEGYTLTASSDRANKVMHLSGTMSPGEFLVVDTTFTMVNSGNTKAKNGEALTLKDPAGVVIDKTGAHKDNEDDDRTWQRSYDGSGEWEFKDATMGRSNGSFLVRNLLTVSDAKDIVLQSAQSAFGEVGSITDLDSLQEVMKLTVRNSLDKLIKKVAGCLVEASIFLKVDVTDPTATASSGIRIALRCDDELVEDVLKYVVGRIESVAMSMKNPYRIDGISMFTDNIDLELTFNTGIQYPRVLARHLEDVPSVMLGITFRTNISALTQVLGYDTGRPNVECGIRIIDCPLEIIPSKLSPKKGMDHDLWLFRMTIEWDRYL